MPKRTVKKKTPNLSKAELKLIAQLLKEASHEFANHGCNDYILPATEENKQIVAQMIEDNGDIDWQDDVQQVLFSKDEIDTCDWWLMAYLANRCKKISEK